jgi:isoamylase
MNTHEMQPGRFTPVPLGAFPDDVGTRFAVAAEGAGSVKLCLFDPSGAEEQLDMPVRDAGIWHGFVPGVKPGQRYGYRVSGPKNAAPGSRFNPAKLLVDPYARALDGEIAWDDTLSGDNSLDSAGSTLRSLVVDPTFDWGGDRPPRIPFADSVIYEAHVKGITARHPQVPEAQRGTYAGLAHRAVIEHLTRLGVTAVELLPVHQSLTNPTLASRALVNYWGYDTIGYFAPHSAYSAEVRAGRAGGQLAEFQEMVRSLHESGLEVLLDVVFNHTGEAGADGPILCLRGLDNAAYYRLDPADPTRYVDTTGCGNSLDTGHPDCLRLVLDCLRYWVTTCHVDGFRFDLAPTLARQDGSFNLLSAFFDVIHQDPVISQVKLIAEPWDVNQPDSYEVGRFPPGWTEWNGKYRDTVRDFWRSKDGVLRELSVRMAGSPDLYGQSRHRPSAPVNLITTHDGFTLRDLVSYDGKHNEANGEDNRDGTDDNRSWNCGAEGPSTDPETVALRGRQSRALLATLLLSRGVPMIVGGDEFGRTQNGNNNAYCQDNETSWFDWAAVDGEQLDFVAELIAFRRAHPLLRRRRFDTAKDISFYTPAGTLMSESDWSVPYAKTLVMHLDGALDPEPDAQGNPLPDDDLVIAVNAWWEPAQVTLPAPRDNAHWLLEFDTYAGSVGKVPFPAAAITVQPRSLVVVRSANGGCVRLERGAEEIESGEAKGDGRDPCRR